MLVVFDGGRFVPGGGIEALRLQGGEYYCTVQIFFVESGVVRFLYPSCLQIRDVKYLRLEASDSRKLAN